MFDFKRNDLNRLKYTIKVFFRILLLFILISVFLLNLFSLAFDLYAVFKCPFPNCGFIAGPYIRQYYSKHLNPSNTSNDSVIESIQEVQRQSNITFQDAVITVATVSGSLSYIIMIKVLIVNYSCLHTFFKWLNTNITLRLIETCKPEGIDGGTYREQQEHRQQIINPFFNGRRRSDDFEPVYLYAKQLFYFYSIFFINLLLYFSNVATLFVIVHRENDANFPNWELFDYFGLAAQLISQYCAIMSCFIFSKVAYAVTTRCHGMLNKYQNIVQDHTDVRGRDDGDISRHHANVIAQLEAEDTEYVKICNESMKPYRVWFSFHWVLYAVTAFMSIAFFAENILTLLYHKPVMDNFMNNLSIIYVSLFTLEHVVLFLYPCFRAASIIEARKTLIHRVSLKHWPPDIKSSFLQFMKEQNCGFVLSCLCIRVSFGFNIAYISIFVGCLGIVLRVFSLF